MIESEEVIISGQAQLELEGPEELVTSISNLPRPEIEARLEISDTANYEKSVRRFIEDARRYRMEGDFNLAEAALQEAIRQDPTNMLALTHYALLEEARDNTTSALEYWKRVIEVGGSDSITRQLARDRAALIEERLRLDAEATRREELLRFSRRLITLDSVETTPTPLPIDPVEIQKDFILQRNRQDLTLDPGKVRVQLFFYDQLSDERLIRSEIEASFVDSPVDWAEGSEVLKARYFKKDSEEGQRVYYGYLLRIYYEDELQDEHASPLSLLRIFPSDSEE